VLRDLGLAACVAFAPMPAHALDPSKAATQYPLETWGTRDSLPAHTIAGMARTGDGYLWFATRGLVRFDGVTFARVDLASKPGPPPLILSVAPADDGGLWILAQSLGLFHYKDGVTKPGPRINAVGFLRPGRDGNLWHVPGDQVMRIRNGTVERRLSVVQGRDVLEDPDGTLWIAAWDAAQGGLLRVRGEEVTRYSAAEGVDPFVSVLARGRDGTLWLGTRKGLTAFREGRFVTYTTRDGLSDDFVTTLLEDRDGNLWVGTAGGGLCRFRDGVFSSVRQADGLVDDNVTALHEDDEGGLWVAGRGGVGRLRSTSFTTYTRREGLPVDSVMEAYPSRDGGVWVSTYGGGLMRFKDGLITPYDTRAGLTNLYVGTVFEASDGAVWFGDGANQLSRLDRGRLKTFDTGKRYVWAIAEDAQGLVVAFPRQGLFRLQGDRFVPYQTASGDVLNDMSIRVLQRGRDGSLWIGGTRGLIHAADGRLTTYAEAQGVKGAVFSLLEDADGTWWIATSTGLLRFKDGAMRRFDDQPYLSDNSIVTVLEDDNGHLWFNSTKALARVAKADLNAYADGKNTSVAIRIFTARDGLKIEEIRTTPTVQRAGRSVDGRLWFPTPRGLSVVDPRHLLRDEKAPPLLVEQLVVDGLVMPATGPLVVSAGAEKVEIRYAALSYTTPERVTFRYRLEGFDDGWVEAGTRRSAFYTKLPPGRYRFQVRATNGDGVTNDVGASLSFAQQPRLHQTVWFRLMLALALVGAAVGVHRLRVRQLKARERELTARVEEALAQVKVLNGLLPICASCKKIRDDTGYWNQMETYIHDHAPVEFSHSICPDCMVKLYPDYAQHKAAQR